MRLSTKLEVHLPRLKHNYLELKKIASQNETIFMVKANAYGHGLLPIVEYASEELGINHFGCASLGEALTIRKELPHLKNKIWVFSDNDVFNVDYISLYLEYNIVPVIASIEELEIILSNKDFKFLPLVLKFNTGMNRLGLLKSDLTKIKELLSLYGRSSVHHIMTHFANSYLKIKENDRTQRQYKEFLEIKRFFIDENIKVEGSSVSNSGAIEQNFGLEETHIRPGLMMYGPSSMGSENWKGQTLSNLLTKVVKIFPVKKGMPIGYGSHVCGHDGFVVHISMGYGDGILTYYSGAKFTYDSKEAQILGRVNMDLTAIHFKELPDSVKVGKEFVIWNNKEKSVNSIAFKTKSIPYQIFTSISSRVPRRYLK